MTQWIENNSNLILSTLLGLLLGAGGVAWMHQETLIRHDERIAENRKDLVIIEEIRKSMHCVMRDVSVIKAHIEDTKRREDRNERASR